MLLSTALQKVIGCRKHKLIGLRNNFHIVFVFDRLRSNFFNSIPEFEIVAGQFHRLLWLRPSDSQPVLDEPIPSRHHVDWAPEESGKIEEAALRWVTRPCNIQRPESLSPARWRHSRADKTSSVETLPRRSDSA